jgi:hypothetical protein
MGEGLKQRAGTVEMNREDEGEGGKVTTMEKR